MRPALVMSAVATFGCAGRPASSSWLEREGPPAAIPEVHATRPAAAGARVPAGDLDALDEAAVLAALRSLGDAAPAGALALRAARLAHHRGDDADARAWLARAATAADEPSVRAAIAGLAPELVAPPPVDPAVIAVLLPLSGTYAAIGTELRAAIQLAPADGTKWLFVDTHGEPEGAAAAVETAVAKGAIGILGPVGVREAVRAARVASLHQIAIGLLAPADGADPSAGVFRLVESPADEARAIAKLAVTEGFPTAGVFAPRDDIGEEAAAAFVAEATRLGIQVTANGSYDPTGGDLEPDVKAFLDLVPAHNPRLAAHLARHGKTGWATFSPDVPYSLLYIPDRYDRAALVAAFLPYYNVELRTSEFPDAQRLQRKHGGHMPQVVQLVGGGGWHHPSLPVRGGAAVQGSLIVDAFAGDLGGDVAVQFGAAFQQRLGRAASTAAAQAFDAAALIARARREASSASDPRTGLRNALAHAAIDDGACGPAAIDPDGEIGRDASVLEVDGDTLILAP